ncbi:MAG: amidase domain-containing protein [Caldisericia bacterium]
MKKILVSLLILGLIGVFGVNILGEKSVRAEEYQIEELINQFFNERVNLLSSKDLEEFDLKLENIKNSLSSYFTNSTLLNDSINELQEIYGMAEGYGRFEIVSIVPLIGIYKIDIKDNRAVSYVQQFILYRVKSKFVEKINDGEIPKEWLVPTDENGIWRAATSSYYTIIIEKENENWKISNLLYGFKKIYDFSIPPKELLPLPDEIRNELERYSVKNNSNIETKSTYRNNAASYADTYWGGWDPQHRYYNIPKYPHYEADCTNFASQCLYESGAFQMDWNNNGTSEQPFSNPPISQEWHINFYSNYNPSYSWTWCPTFDYYLLHNQDFPYKGPRGWIENQGYMHLWKGDIVICDYNYNNIPDHAAIVVAFEYYTGSPLCDSHSRYSLNDPNHPIPDEFHVFYGNESIFHNIHIDYEKQNIP